MSDLEIRRISGEDPFRFEVRASDGKRETRHAVAMSHAQFGTLSRGSATPEQCVRAAFRFLLDREPADAILKQFDTCVIERYFPEFPREFPRYLAMR